MATRQVYIKKTRADNPKTPPIHAGLERATFRTPRIRRIRSPTETPLAASASAGVSLIHGSGLLPIAPGKARTTHSLATVLFVPIRSRRRQEWNFGKTEPIFTRDGKKSMQMGILRASGGVENFPNIRYNRLRCQRFSNRRSAPDPKPSKNRPRKRLLKTATW